MKQPLFVYLHIFNYLCFWLFQYNYLFERFKKIIMRALHLISKVAIVGLLFFFTACATGYKAYQKGDYYRACIQAINQLRSKPNNEKARFALINAYPLAQANAMRNITNAFNSSDIRQYDRAIAIYRQMNELADEINRCPAALALIPAPTEYHGAMRETMEMVAELSYNEGLKALRVGTIDQARIALENFNRTNKYIPGYKDVLSKLAEARYLATLRVIVLAPAVTPRYQINADFFYIKLMSDITRRTYSRLVRFYTPEEAHLENMQSPHELLVLNFEDFTIGNSKESSSSVEVKRDNVLIGKTGTGENVYGTVKAKFTSRRIELMSGGVLSVRIVDPVTNRILRQTNLQRSTVWKTEWASYNGDERALTDQQRALVAKRPLPVPPPQELFNSFADPLYAQASSFINSRY